MERTGNRAQRSRTVLSSAIDGNHCNYFNLGLNESKGNKVKVSSVNPHLQTEAIKNISIIPESSVGQSWSGRFKKKEEMW